MIVSQSKIDLAVLWKLYHHSESGGGAIPPSEVQALFKTSVPARRIQLALEQLESDGLVEKEYHPHYFDEGLWTVTREGLRRVERALRVPASFIARLSENGDAWLNSTEAQNAVLKKLDPIMPARSAVIETSTGRPANPIPAVRTQGINWTKWGTLVGAVGIGVTVLLWWWS